MAWTSTRRPATGARSTTSATTSARRTGPGAAGPRPGRPSSRRSETAWLPASRERPPAVPTGAAPRGRGGSLSSAGEPRPAPSPLRRDRRADALPGARPVASRAGAERHRRGGAGIGDDLPREQDLVRRRSPLGRPSPPALCAVGTPARIRRGRQRSRAATGRRRSGQGAMPLGLVVAREDDLLVGRDHQPAIALDLLVELARRPSRHSPAPERAGWGRCPRRWPSARRPWR